MPNFIQSMNPDAPTNECQSYWCYWNRVYSPATIEGVPRYREMGTKGANRGGCDQRTCANWNGLINNSRGH